MDKPDVDLIDGLSPAIAIDQKSSSHNPRSTVGTITEVYDYLRLLYARIGVQHCIKDSTKLSKLSLQQLVDHVLQFPDSTRFLVLAPIVRGRKGEYVTLLTTISAQGFTRARIDGETVEINDFLKQTKRLARYETHTIEIIVDRLVSKKGIQRRLTDSLETALKLADGVAQAEIQATNESITLSANLSCPKCATSYEEPVPRNFSFNSPYGACETCLGLGTSFEVDPELIIPDPNLSIAAGALAPWRTAHTQYFIRTLHVIAQAHNIDLSEKWSKLPKKAQNIILHGGADNIQVKYKNKYGRTREYSTSYEGIVPWIKRRHKDADSDHARDLYESYMRTVPCSACLGARLKPTSLAVLINGKSISDVTAMSISDSAKFLKTLKLNNKDSLISKSITKEINARLGFLLDVGLDYLTLARSAATLAGGESQRIRLASQIGSGLVGTLYVLDEPSIGLHQRDNHRLITTLKKLRDLGNTVLIVEHDEDTIRASDWIVDIGPGAGEHGGKVVYNGPVKGILKVKNSLTGQYLSGKKSIETPQIRRTPSKEFIKIRGAREHNLKNLNVKIPLGCFVAVTGVSGSGKSTLIRDILLPSMMQKIYKSKQAPGHHTGVDGIEHIDKVIDMDQSPIGRTPRSNPATYTGVFDDIRKLFASTPESKLRGYLPGRFSFNVPGGRCEACNGDGTLRIEMHFLPDVYVPCETCKSARYNRDTLEITFKGKNISEILNMPISKAAEFFANQPRISRFMQTLMDVGLGYVRLGQAAPTLSGGEAQRVKLATELAKRGTGHTIYLLDEPTTGLHFEDVRRLLVVLSRLVDQGNTVLVIEHNLDVIKTADWIIDLGPEGGSGGGTVVAQGTPETVAKIPASHTGKYLAELLKK
jgi:excinuclease ABC subunit A